MSYNKDTFGGKCCADYCDEAPVGNDWYCTHHAGIYCWEEGDKVASMGGWKYDVFPGLFWYSAWGMGTFFHPDGWKISCTTTDGREIAKAAGVGYKEIDSFAGYSGTYLGD